MFVREVAEAVGGVVRDVMDAHRAGTAYQTMLNFRDTPYTIWEGDGFPPSSLVIQEGDIAYKGRLTSGAAGHTAYFVNGRRVGLPPDVLVLVENSSYHILPGHYGNVSGAKGFRTLHAFGAIEAIVRLTA